MEWDGFWALSQDQSLPGSGVVHFPPYTPPVTGSSLPPELMEFTHSWPWGFPFITWEPSSLSAPQSASGDSQGSFKARGQGEHACVLGFVPALAGENEQGPWAHRAQGAINLGSLELRVDGASRASGKGSLGTKGSVPGSQG